MKELSIGVRVRLVPAPIVGMTIRWSGLEGTVIGFPGADNVRVAIDGGEFVTCGPCDVQVLPLEIGK